MYACVYTKYTYAHTYVYTTTTYIHIYIHINIHLYSPRAIGLEGRAPGAGPDGQRRRAAAAARRTRPQPGVFSFSLRRITYINSEELEYGNRVNYIGLPSFFVGASSYGWV